MIDDKVFSYLALFSHELKSPLNTIINSAKLIELHVSEEKNIKKYLSLIISSAFYLKTLIQNTIELGKLGFENALHIEKFDIVDMIREIADLTKIMVEGKKIEVIFNPSKNEIFIVSDPIKVKQILLNISSNSAKFTRQGYIKFMIDEMKEGVLINIKDSGCGIKKEQLDKIFNPYCSLQVRSETLYESSGLGLFITKHLLSILGGDILIKSEHNKGTEVEVFIPSKKQQ